MKLNIGQYIYSALSAIVVAPAATANDTPQLLTVFPVIADFNTAVPRTPFAVYQRTACHPEYTKDGFTGEISHSYSVTVADNDFNNTANLAESVANALIGLSHQVKAGIKFNQVLLTDLSEDFIEGIYTQTLQFEINTTEI